MLPKFDDHGLLPPGEWPSTLDEVRDRFCWNDHRRMLWTGLIEFLRDVYDIEQLGVPVWVDGSFTRSKELPSDIDIVLDCTRSTDAVLGKVIAVFLNRVEMKRRYHVDVWPRHPKIANDLSQYFQYVGEKAAAELTIDPKHPKGIVKVQP